MFRLEEPLYVDVFNTSLCFEKLLPTKCYTPNEKLTETYDPKSEKAFQMSF